MENVKVIIWGLGAMGGGIADMLLKKKGVDIVGVVDWEAKVGKSMYEFIKTPKGDRPDVIIGAAEDVIKPGSADIVMVCTDSFTKNVFPKIKFIVERGINVITSAEEMSYPKAQNPELAEEMDRLAKANDTYYLLKKTQVPIVIVECGFLSNWEESKKLQDENYQDKLVWAISMGTQRYLNHQ